MDKLLQLLAANGLEMDDRGIKNLRENIKAMGYDPDKLTSPQVGQIAADVLKSPVSTLAPINNKQNKPTASKSKRSTRKDRTNDIADALSTAVSQSSGEVRSIVEPIREGIEAWTEHEAEAVVDAIAEMPNVFLAKLGEKALAHAEDSDPAFFRQVGERLRSVFIPSV